MCITFSTQNNTVFNVKYKELNQNIPFWSDIYDGKIRKIFEIFRHRYIWWSIYEDGYLRVVTRGGVVSVWASGFLVCAQIAINFGTRKVEE